MLALKDSMECAHFFGRLRQAPCRALLLDYDGTIAPFTAERRNARPYPVVMDLLGKIVNCGYSRVVMITGRSAKDLKSLLDGGPCPEIWGTHGLERLKPDGSYELMSAEAEQACELAEAEAWLSKEGLTSLGEVKPGAIAVHWRGLSVNVANEVRAAAYRVWSPIAARAGVKLAEFDGGLELRMSTCNKGNAVRTILGELGPASVAAYLGDDRTDEDAFRALRENDLAVLVRPECRETAAALWIKPPEELLQFLMDWQKACGGEPC
jgi:trehalose 6-phosphate phosphatase